MTSQHIVSVKLYATIFGALLVLTLATAGVAFIDLGGDVEQRGRADNRDYQGVVGGVVFYACSPQQPPHLGLCRRRIVLAGDINHTDHE